ncbi:hypothetical protein VTK56DRAFT_1219 [Thermocarpiscus australiensis]
MASVCKRIWAIVISSSPLYRSFAFNFTNNLGEPADWNEEMAHETLSFTPKVLNRARGRRVRVGLPRLQLASSRAASQDYASHTLLRHVNYGMNNGRLHVPQLDVRMGICKVPGGKDTAFVYSYVTGTRVDVDFDFHAELFPARRGRTRSSSTTNTTSAYIPRSPSIVTRSTACYPTTASSARPTGGASCGRKLPTPLLSVLAAVKEAERRVKSRIRIANDDPWHFFRVITVPGWPPRPERPWSLPLTSRLQVYGAQAADGRGDPAVQDGGEAAYKDHDGVEPTITTL